MERVLGNIWSDRFPMMVAIVSHSLLLSLRFPLPMPTPSFLGGADQPESPSHGLLVFIMATRGRSGLRQQLELA